MIIHFYKKAISLNIIEILRHILTYLDKQRKFYSQHLKSEKNDPFFFNLTNLQSISIVLPIITTNTGEKFT